MTTPSTRAVSTCCNCCYGKYVSTPSAPRTTIPAQTPWKWCPSVLCPLWAVSKVSTPSIRWVPTCSDCCYGQMSQRHQLSGLLHPPKLPGHSARVSTVHAEPCAKCQLLSQNQFPPVVTAATDNMSQKCQLPGLLSPLGVPGHGARVSTVHAESRTNLQLLPQD